MKLHTPFLLIGLLAISYMAFTLSSAAQDQEGAGTAGEAPSGPVRTREYNLGRHGSNKLSVLITRQADSEDNGEERIVCKFFDVSDAGDRTAVGLEISAESGFADADQVRVGDFLRNGRKQVFVATFANSTRGEVYDFDGEQVRVVYDTAVYDGRKYLDIRRGRNGQALIQEEFSAPYGLRRNEDEFPPGVIYVKDRGICVRLVRWQNGAWTPIKFRYMDKTDEAIPR